MLLWNCYNFFIKILTVLFQQAFKNVLQIKDFDMLV